MPTYFYPRSPCGERRYLLQAALPSCYFYPRSPCGERPVDGGIINRSAKISIHALLAESDPRYLKMALAQSISIHALLAESDGHPSRIP